MRFLLINPNYPISEGPSPPLGIAFLGAALEAAGIETKVLDFVVHPYSKAYLEKALQTFQPDFAGLTSVTMTFNNAVQIAKDIKEINSNVLTVMGGPHVSFCAEETMKKYPDVDFIVMGEGDDTVVDLARVHNNGREWEKIEGIVYRKHDEIFNTGKRSSLPDYNELNVPARHLLPLGRYRALNMPVSMTTSRGCPHKCIFCVGRKMVGARVRYRDAIKVVDELEYLSTLNFPQINIADDLFTANKRHCTAICDEIIKRALHIKWSSFARVDTASYDVFTKMKAAGCTSVSFGVESANAGILKTVKKGITVPQVIEAVKICNDTGITPSASFILGLPGETPSTLKETVKFGKKLQDMGVIYGFHLLAPFPGTELREEKDRLGIKILTHDWDMYHANRAIVETDSVTGRMLDDIAIKWEDDINLWLASIEKKIRNGTATDEDAFPLVNLNRTVLYYDLMMNSVIEEKGTWEDTDGTASKSKALATLVKRIGNAFGNSSEDIFSALDYASNRGNLLFNKTDNRILWKWRDYL